jgi:hypothetical protein
LGQFLILGRRLFALPLGLYARLPLRGAECFR